MPAFRIFLLHVNTLPMKTLFLFVLICCALPVQAQVVDLYKMPKSSENQTALRHVVLLKFKEGAPSDEIQKFEMAFASLPSKIPEIRAFEWGLNNSKEGLDKGFTHCFIVTFDSEADRDAYLPHPDHQALVKIMIPLIEDSLVLDYWVK